MRHMLFTGLVLLFVFCGGAFATTPEYRDGYILVRFAEAGFSSTANATRQAVVTAAGGGTIEKMYTIVPGLALVKLPDGVSVPTAKSKFRATIGVRYAEPDHIGKFAAVPNDTNWGRLWGLHNAGQTGGKPDADIDAPEAWDIQKGKAQIIVAVCDSGVDYTHEDLQANMWVNQAEFNGLPGVDDDGNGYVDDIYGYDFANGTGQIVDNIGHGTHVAGTIGAVGNNSLGVVGVNWTVRIMALKIGDYFISLSAAIEAIQYSINMGARVMNHSWGGYMYNQALVDAITASRDAGVLFVAAAGNEYNDNDIMPAYPASYKIDNIISVLATDHNDQKAVFSNWGKSSVHLGAPGQNILSTMPGNLYGMMSGTSMASPHVTGAAALLFAENPSLSYSVVKQILTSTVDKVPSLKGILITEGRMNLHRAMLAAQAGDMLPPTPDPMEWTVAPIAVGANTIYMEAAAATDASGVQYMFECVGNAALNSGWQDSPIYYRGGFTALTTYQFRALARDKSQNLNVTQPSEIVEVTTPEVDNLPPYPNPAQWASFPRKVSNISIVMEAATAYDEFGTDVNYYFECVFTSDPAYAHDPGLLSQGPQTDAMCFVNGVSVASPGNVYTFRVRAEDHLGNMTDWSDEATVVMAPPPVTRTVPSSTYPTIQRAINASNHGDTVVVHPGVYREINIDLKGRRITVRSLNPDDPGIVASTVIDCEEPQTLWAREARRAFLIQNGEGRDTVLAGLTIRNATAVDDPTYNPGIAYTGVPRRGDGEGYYYDGPDAYGGAIYIGRKIPNPASANPRYPDTLATIPASPTIRNCVFVNCSALGSYGQTGPNATNAGNDSPGNPGARGGDGGNAYGGAIFAVDGSSPLIKKCRFYSCRAVGGNAGNGGNGSNGGGHSNGVTAADGWRGGDGGDAGRGGVAYGGAIYFEPNSLPELYDVIVSDSYVQVGEAGRGGNAGNGSDAKSAGRGGHGGNGGVGGDLRGPTASGGAIYFGENSQVILEGSIIENCRVIAELSGDYSGGNGGNAGNGQGQGFSGGNGGHGGPAYFIPDKMRDIGGVTATGGTGGNGGNGNTPGGNGGFRFGQGGSPGGGNFYSHTGIFPSNLYYMAYYWEDTANIVNMPESPAEHFSFTYVWEWDETITEEEVPFYDPSDPNVYLDDYTRFTIQAEGIFCSPFSPYYGLLSYSITVDPLLTVVQEPIDPNIPDGETRAVLVPDYDVLFIVDEHAEVVETLTPTNPDEPVAGAVAGGNFYGRNSVVRMKDTTIVNNRSFANHGGGELYAKGCDASFIDCRFEGNATLYTMQPWVPAEEEPVGRNMNTDYKFEGYGGAIFADQPVRMSFTGCDFVENQGYAGGALYCNFAPSDPNAPEPSALALTDCTFTENRADYHFMYSYGGAVYAGNSLDPYEEYYFNFLMNLRTSHALEYYLLLYPFYPTQYYWMYPSDAFYDLDNFISAVYDHSHGRANFIYAAIATTLWDDILEADHILYGQSAPRYQVPMTKCTFEGNAAPYGAGFYADASIVDVTGSRFIENMGQSGVGGYTYASDLLVRDSMFDKNLGTDIPTLGAQSQQDSSTVSLYGSGGALYIAGCDLSMINNTFTTNEVTDGGGAVYIVGPSLAGAPQTLVNNLFADNASGTSGGALVATGVAHVEVSQSTFVENTVSDLISGVGGAVMVNDAFMSVQNSIFWDNLAAIGSQAAVGDPLSDPYYTPYSTLWVKTSDVQGGKPGIFVGGTGWTSLIYRSQDKNIDANPLFAHVSDPNDASEQTFYLSQIEAGQLQNSPCLDTGAGTVASLFSLLGFEGTTRTDHVVDTNPLNMGVYYNAALPTADYTLTASVYVADFYPHGKLFLTYLGLPPVEVGKDPYSVTLKQGVQVLLTAVPDANYRVKRWIGTDDDTSWANTNTVTMAGVRNVRVEFELAIAKRLFVPEAYQTIEDAIKAARSGDTIVLAMRTDQAYTITNPEGLNFGGRKNITLTSTNPKDPHIVANTVIDARGTRYTRKRALNFNNGEDPNTIIEGITIRNAFWAGAIGLSGVLPDPLYPDGFPPANPSGPPRALSGMDATGNGYGGAILVTNGSSPTIRDVVFENCTVAGGIGGDGNHGDFQNVAGMTGDRDGQSGGHGGYGYGNGFGGAIAVIEGSSPSITNCIFRNNRATGGWGGIPGHGGFPVGNGRYTWGGDAGDGEGDGRGGAIYVEAGCTPTVMSNVFEGNFARLGYVSAGGRARGGSAYPAPYDEETYPIERRHGRNGRLWSYGTVAGGAVFFGEEADSYLKDSVFENNQAYLPLPANVTLSYYTIAADVYDYTRGGAIFTDPNVILTIENCQFVDSRGGAIYASSGSDLVVTNTRFENNATYDPETGKSGVYNLEAYYVLDVMLGLAELSEQPAGAITVEANAAAATRIEDCQFVGNLSDGSGGAVHSKSDLTITGSSFTTNDAILRGGAIFSYRHIADPNTKTLVVSLTDNEFIYNRSDELGGAVYAKNNILDIQNCQFVGNKAPSGGGLLAVEGEVEMARNLFVANEATGLAQSFDMIADPLTSILFSIYGGTAMTSTHQTVRDEGIGGGVYLVDTSAAIVDTRILNNKAAGTNALGGGLTINGGQGVLTHNLQNCLIAGNSSQRNGGGVMLMTYADPRFDNCTIADNTAGQLGGGMYTDWTSRATIVNSILFGNSPTEVAQQTSNSVTTVPAFSINPKFVDGPLGKYYLDPSSLAINAGNTTAAAVELDTYTTNPAIPVVYDTGTVDLGYHYDPADLAKTFTLSADVRDSQGGLRGTVTPASGTYYYGQIVDLTAALDTDYVITGWSGGTFNDTSMATTNSVLFVSDKTITVKVRRRQTLVVGGSSGFPNLQDAIDAAQNGDNILIQPGIYNPPVGVEPQDYYGYLASITLGSKSLRISGVNPDDENTVRNTVLANFLIYVNGAPKETLIEGVTLQYGSLYIYGGSPTIRNVVFRECRWGGGTATKTLNCGNVVMDGGYGGSVLGGAVTIFEGAPHFANCTFEDNWARGGNGQEGASGCQQHPEGGDGGWPGRGYGGAVYAAFSSKPTFESCTFTGNQALGGVGGNGGVGATIAGTAYRGGRGGGFLWPDSIENDPLIWSWFDGWEDGDKYWFYSNFFGQYDWELWVKWFGWTKWNSWQEFFASVDYQSALTVTPKVDSYDEYWKYSGFGGAVYVGYLSEASFVNCVFEGNETRGSLSGVGGLSGNGRFPTPDRQLNLPNAGGAVYAAYDSSLVFTNCRFADNLADTSTVEVPHTYEVSFGGAVAYEFDCDVTFHTTDIQGNRSAVGGGIYGRDSTLQVVDCNAFDNEAFFGAGLYIDRGAASITSTLVQANNAKQPDVVVIPPDEEPGEGEEPVVPVATLASVGQGGGLYAASAGLDLRHSVFVKNNAVVSGGGLLLSGTVETPSNLFNNLFAQNKAGRDGAGASVNWESRATFGNCTFADNQCIGYGTTPYNPGTGGGLYIAYNSIVDVIDSIFWGNVAAQGAQITVGTGFEFDPRPSTLTITYSDVQGYGSASAIFRGQGCTVNPAVPVGMLSGNPLFNMPADTLEEDVVSRYYLQASSPCIDAGSTTAFVLGLSDLTTSIMGGGDRGNVDLGYHYGGSIVKSECSKTDFVLTGRIDPADLVWFASKWLDNTCGEDDWCAHVDLNFDRTVDIYDFASFASCWRVEDDEPPFPNPSVWVQEPNAVPETFYSIMMIADTAHDAWRTDANISYYFECLENSALSSEWQASTFYALPSGQKPALVPGDEYTFTVRARDARAGETNPSVVINETAPSLQKSVKPGDKVTLTPMFAANTPYVSAAGTVRMEAVPYSGVLLPSGVSVQYQFEFVGSPDGGLNGDSSDWQASPIYVDAGLTEGRTYQYQLRMRFINTQNSAFAVSAPSAIATVVVTPMDADAPTPNPAEFIEGSPFQFFRSADSTYYQISQAVEAVDVSGVEYRFRCYTGATGGSVVIDSGWRSAASVAGLTYPNGQVQVPHIFWGNVGISHLGYHWTVQTRDQSSMQNTGLESPRKQVMP